LHAFPLDRYHLFPGNFEAGSGQAPGLAHGSTLILRVYDRCEDGPAARFGQGENDFADDALLLRLDELQAL
jgi:hypothetical protein